MNDITSFRETLKLSSPPTNFNLILQSLWYDTKGDWDKAHAQVDQLNDRESAWVHAYLHRKEGDLWNADYWYTRAKKSRPHVSLDAEWEELISYFLKNEKK
ncbi:hypothetical protein G9H64_01285 [Aquirufa nivalisilvae]|uniref:hypothetical protein n=1 Tax=Aquirufa nivalisilvae TaxID=2516557 RepID=UPI0022A90EEE|nr:hypothetical protein [Aquirufa nivalisilvae]MCZ2481573.1 hypothetical protein [Aquirufa nivalisilvae]